MLEIQNISKRYGKGVLANDDISLKIASGEVFALLGPNGAGKTTLVHQIVGLVRPSCGTIHIGGHDIVKQPALARRLCAFQPQSQIPIDGLNPYQAIEMTGRIRGLDRRCAKRRAGELIERLQLQPWAKVPGERLSGGIRRLTAFAMTLSAQTPVVVLDEPTNDVDPQRRRYLWQEIRSLADQGSTVILVTHNVLEAERVADRLAMIHQARLIRQGSPADFRGKTAKSMVLEMILEPEQVIAAGPDHKSLLQQGRRVFCPLDLPDIDEHVRWAMHLKDRGVIEEFSISPPSLEEAYLKLIQAPSQLQHQKEGA